MSKREQGKRDATRGQMHEAEVSQAGERAVRHHPHRFSLKGAVYELRCSNCGHVGRFDQLEPLLTALNRCPGCRKRKVVELFLDGQQRLFMNCPGHRRSLRIMVCRDFVNYLLGADFPSSALIVNPDITMGMAACKKCWSALVDGRSSLQMFEMICLDCAERGIAEAEASGIPTV